MLKEFSGAEANVLTGAVKGPVRNIHGSDSPEVLQIFTSPFVITFKQA
jgi:hypothetical protein